MPFTSLGAGTQKSETRRVDLKNVFAKIIELAKENKVDVLLISGDVYENKYVKKSTINYINDKFTEIRDVEVFIVPGNHDPHILKSFYMDFEWSGNVHILSDEKPFFFLEKANTCIYGAGFSDYSKTKSDLSEYNEINTELINILIFHGTIDLNINKDTYNHVTSEELNSLNMDYVALGHFHNRIDDIGGYGNIFNPGSPEPLGFDEEGDHGVYVGTIEKNERGPENSAETYISESKPKLEIEYISTALKSYKNISVSISGCNTDENAVKTIKDGIKNSMKPDEKPLDCLFYITLNGICEKGFKLNIKFVENTLKDEFFFVRIKDLTRMDYDIVEISKEPGIRGLFVQKINKMMENAENDRDRERLSRALYYGLDALGRGRVEI
jgi:DNA repair exonuclease SbcCD nuclease subunit